MMPTDPKKRTIARSFADAFRGVGDCIRTERNMRIHLTMCVYVLFFASRIELTRGEMACLLLAIGSVVTAETLNTSVEKLCDFTQKHTNHLIRVIKDMAAGAVLICAVFAALVSSRAVGSFLGHLYRPGIPGAFSAFAGCCGGVCFLGSREVDGTGRALVWRQKTMSFFSTDQSS